MNECLSVVLCWITLLFVYRFSKYTIYFFSNKTIKINPPFQ